MTPEEISTIIERLFPLCRSITGEGVRETLRILSENIPLTVHEVPSGTAMFDWTAPEEWRINSATLSYEDGTPIVDFADSNLHVVNYSTGIDQVMSFDELTPHLHSLPEQPSVTPYRTSYWNRDWGFCLPHDALAALDPAKRYHAFIDAEHFDGSLTYGELLIPGTDDIGEILLSTHVCHPSLANDNLSGIAALWAIAQAVSSRPLRHDLRLLFVPGTVGSLAWLSQNEQSLERVRYGLVVTGLGDPAQFAYKQTPGGEAAIDRAVALSLRDTEHQILDWYPYGYDERQYCSPGLDLPVGRLSRGVHAEFPEYHTSADDLEFVDTQQVLKGIGQIEQILRICDENAHVTNLAPKGEPQLGKRGLYSAVGGAIDVRSVEQALLWVLALGKGDTDLIEIAERSQLPFSVVLDACVALEQADLIERSW